MFSRLLKAISKIALSVTWIVGVITVSGTSASAGGGGSMPPLLSDLPQRKDLFVDMLDVYHTGSQNKSSLYTLISTPFDAEEVVMTVVGRSAPGQVLVSKSYFAITAPWMLMTRDVYNSFLKPPFDPLFQYPNLPNIRSVENSYMNRPLCTYAYSLKSYADQTSVCSPMLYFKGSGWYVDNVDSNHLKNAVYIRIQATARRNQPGTNIRYDDIQMPVISFRGGCAIKAQGQGAYCMLPEKKYGSY